MYDIDFSAQYFPEEMNQHLLTHFINESVGYSMRGDVKLLFLNFFFSKGVLPGPKPMRAREDFNTKKYEINSTN